MKQLACILLIGILSASCQPGNQNGNQTPDGREHSRENLLWDDSVSDDSAGSKDTLKTIDSLQSPSFP